MPGRIIDPTQPEIPPGMGPIPEDACEACGARIILGGGARIVGVGRAGYDESGKTIMGIEAHTLCGPCVKEWAEVLMPLQNAIYDAFHKWAEGKRLAAGLAAGDGEESPLLTGSSDTEHGGYDPDNRADKEEDE